MEHNYRRTPIVRRDPYVFEQVDDLFGNDLTGGGLPDEGAGMPVPALSIPREHPAQGEPLTKETERAR